MSIVLLDETNDANSDDLRVVHFFLNLTMYVFLFFFFAIVISFLSSSPNT